MGCLTSTAKPRLPQAAGSAFASWPAFFDSTAARIYRAEYITYGLDTYGRIWDRWIERRAPGPFRYSLATGSKILACRDAVHHRPYDSGGTRLDSDGWATTRAHFILPPGNGTLRLRGSLRGLGPKLRGQTICVECNGGRHDKVLSFGEFDALLAFAPSTAPLNITLRATRYVCPLRKVWARPAPTGFHA